MRYSNHGQKCWDNLPKLTLLTSNRILHFAFSFSSVVNPSLPTQCWKTLRACLFASNIDKAGRGVYLSRQERGEFTLRKKAGNIHVSKLFVHDWGLLLAFHDSEEDCLKGIGPLFQLLRIKNKTIATLFPRSAPSACLLVLSLIWISTSAAIDQSACYGLSIEALSLGFSAVKAYME